jgi:hypothetical protein
MLAHASERLQWMPTQKLGCTILMGVARRMRSRLRDVCGRLVTASGLLIQINAALAADPIRGECRSN